MKVLVVDDEADIRDSLREFLEDEGYSVASASNGAEALGVLGERDLPGVVILDLAMPKMSGSELYSRMQCDPRLCNVPVLVSTSNPSLVPRGVPALKKPVDLDRLLTYVQEHDAARAPPS